MSEPQSLTPPPMGSSPAPPAGRARVHRRRLASLRAITALILREMTSSYGRSPGGYLWKVLEPVAGIALLTVMFGLFMRQPSLGTNFALFYATGLLPFMTFLSVSGAVAQALRFSRPLLAYPAVTWLDALIARFVLNFLTELMVAYLLFFGILTIFRTRVIVDLPVVAGALALCGLLALGVGALNCFLFTRFQVWQRVWSILMRPMFLISGIFFLPERVPQPWRDYLWWNPLMQVIGLMRRGFYVSYPAPYVSVPYVLAFSGLCLLAGMFLLARYEKYLRTL